MVDLGFFAQDFQRPLTDKRCFESILVLPMYLVERRLHDNG
jgi:hypothetical protein